MKGTNASLTNRLVYFPIVIFPLMLFAPIILAGKALFWGTPALQFIPWHIEAVHQLQQGFVPLWNPHNGMGAPLAANYQSALFYPPNWPVLLVGWLAGPRWLAWAHTVAISLHLVWMGIGVSHLVKRLGYGRLNQSLAGLAFALCGYFVARTSFFSMVWAGAWIPWMLDSASKIAYPGGQLLPGRRPLVHGGMVVFGALQLLAGHAQLTWYSWLLVTAWLTAGGWNAGRLKGVVAVAKAALPSVLLAAGLAAVQLTVTAEYLYLSQRSSAVDFEQALTYSFWPWRLLGFLLPDLFGNPGSGNYWGYASFWEDAVYIGVLPIILALLTLKGIFRTRDAYPGGREEQQLVRFLWGVILVSIVLALGKHTPIYPFLFRYLPTFDMFNSPARYLIGAEVSLVLLAGIGAQRWRRPQRRGLYWLRLATAGGFAVTLGAFLAILVLDDIRLTFIRATAVCGLFALVSGVLTLLHPTEATPPRRRGWWQVVVVAIIGFDLLIANWNNVPGVDSRLYTPPAYRMLEQEPGSGRLYMHPSTEYFIKFRRFFRFADYSGSEPWDNLHAIPLPNFNLVTELDSANNFDPLISERYNRWMKALGGLPETQREPWYRLMNISLEIKRDRTAENMVRYERVAGQQRFWFFACAQFVTNDEQAWQVMQDRMGQETTSPWGSSLVLTGEGSPGGECDGAMDVDVQVIRDEPDFLEIQVNSGQGGWLQISDAWYPGWKARINQKPAQLYSANYLFRAVQIPAGESHIVLRYAPWSFRVGGGITLLSVLLAAAIALKRIMH